MNIEDLTLKQIREIQSIGFQKETINHFDKKYIGQKVIIRTYSAGVHYGILHDRCGIEVELTSAIRLWSWDGACSLSQLASEGTKNASNCKFSVKVEKILLTEAVEVIPCTQVACDSIEGVTPWKK